MLFGKEKKKRIKETPNTKRRNSSLPSNPTTNQSLSQDACTLLIEALGPIMTSVIKSDQLDSADVRHRAILGGNYH